MLPTQEKCCPFGCKTKQHPLGFGYVSQDYWFWNSYRAESHRCRHPFPHWYNSRHIVSNRKHFYPWHVYSLFFSSFIWLYTNPISPYRGYMPPEYITNGTLSKKHDVYGFGVTLLEVINGMSRSKRASSQCSIQWVSECWPFELVTR